MHVGRIIHRLCMTQCQSMSIKVNQCQLFHELLFTITMSDLFEHQMANNSRATRRMKHPEIPQEPLVVLTTETCSCIQNQRTCPHASTAEANRILDEFDACLTENCQTDLSSLQPFLENVLSMPPRDAERFARGWRISSSTRDV